MIDKAKSNKTICRVISILLDIIVAIGCIYILPSIAPFVIFIMIITQCLFNKMVEHLNLFSTFIIVNIFNVVFISGTIYGGVQIQNTWNNVKQEYNIIKDYALNLHASSEEENETTKQLFLELALTENEYHIINSDTNEIIQEIDNEEVINAINSINEKLTGICKQRSMSITPINFYSMSDKSHFEICYSRTGKIRKSMDYLIVEVDKNWYVLIDRNGILELLLGKKRL